MRKAIEKRVDNLLNQSPKALARMAAQMLWDVENGKVTPEEGCEAMEVFANKFVMPMDATTRSEYRIAFSELRENKLRYEWFKTVLRLNESRLNHLIVLKCSLKIEAMLYEDLERWKDEKMCVLYAEVMRERLKKDVKEHESYLIAVSEQIKEFEAQIKDWHDPDIWQLIGYEPPVADAQPCES